MNFLSTSVKFTFEEEDYEVDQSKTDRIKICVEKEGVVDFAITVTAEPVELKEVDDEQKEPAICESTCVCVCVRVCDRDKERVLMC